MLQLNTFRTVFFTWLYFLVVLIEMTFYPIPTQLGNQHVSLTKQFTEKPKTDVLRDPKKSEVESMDWNASGEKLILCSRDGNLKLWRADRLMEERVWPGSWTWTECHPTDPNILSAVSWDGKVKLVDLRAAHTDIDLKKTRNLEKFLSCSYSIDGNWLAIVTRTDLIHVLDLSTGGAEVSTIQPGCEVYSVCFDSMGRLWVATGGTPGRILIYSRDGSLVSEFFAHAHVVSCLARSRDPNLIVSGGSDALVSLWDVGKLGCVRTFPNSVSPVTSVSVNQDNSLVAWGSGAIGAKDGEAVISIAGLETGYHYASIPVAAPASRIKWHPTKQVMAYSMQQAPGADTNIHIMTFPSSE